MSRTVITRSLSQDVSKQSGNAATVVEDSYVIPDGSRVRIDSFLGGHEYSTKEVRIELVLRNGSDVIICVGYGGSFQFQIDREYIGDGTKAVVMRLYNKGNSDLHMTSVWDGWVDG